MTGLQDALDGEQAKRNEANKIDEILRQLDKDDRETLNKALTQKTAEGRYPYVYSASVVSGALEAMGYKVAEETIRRYRRNRLGG